MATAYIVELEGAGKESGNSVPVPVTPVVTHQRVSYTTSTQSAAFNGRTRLIELDLAADAYIEIGPNPTATTSTWRVTSASCPRTFQVRAGDKIAVYDGSS